MAKTIAFAAAGAVATVVLVFGSFAIFGLFTPLSLLVIAIAWLCALGTAVWLGRRERYWRARANTSDSPALAEVTTRRSSVKVRESFASRAKIQH